jgi:hypothetical protein
MHPYQNLETELIDIVRQGHGRLRGHFLAGLEIMDDQEDKIAVSPWRIKNFNHIPFGLISNNYPN